VLRAKYGEGAPAGLPGADVRRGIYHQALISPPIARKLSETGTAPVECLQPGFRRRRDARGILGVV